MKILYADDHWITRNAARHLLDRLVEHSEVIEANDFNEALEIISSTPDLDLILLDLIMPGLKRVEDLSEVRRCRPQVPVVVMSAIEERSVILRCINAGAMGYIPKSARGEEVESSLQTVLDGGVAYPRRLLEQENGFNGTDLQAIGNAGSLAEVRSRLTERQLDVFRCLGQGMANGPISGTLGISEHTVRVHISAIVKRLRLKNRTQAAITAASLINNL